MNRKINLDTEVFCIGTGGSYGGEKDCDHDYPPEPTKEEPTFACWTCSKCGMKRCYDVWD